MRRAEIGLEYGQYEDFIDAVRALSSLAIYVDIKPFSIRVWSLAFGFLNIGDRKPFSTWFEHYHRSPHTSRSACYVSSGWNLGSGDLGY